MPEDVATAPIESTPQVRTQNRKLVFIAALASVVITAIESTIVSTSMPTVVASLGGFDLLSWVFTAYLLTQAITVPIYGRLSDLYGRKPILLTGVAFFAVGSLLCGFAPTMFMLVLCRTVQGFGSGALVSVGRTLIGDIFSGPERARMQGVVSSGFIGAGLLGPMIGAFLVTHTVWPMIFWINVPIALAAGAILFWGFQEKIEKRRHRIDWGGAALICVGTGMLMFALAQTSAMSFGAKGGLLAAAVAVLFVFVLYERGVPEPIWPMSLFRDRVAASGNLVSLATGATTLGIAAYLPVYIQGVIGDSAAVSGVTIMALSVGGPLGAATAGQVMLRSSYRTSASMGAAIYIVGSIMMTLLTPQSGAAWAAASGLLIGLGVGMNNNTYLVAVQSEIGLESAWYFDIGFDIHPDSRSGGRRVGFRRYSQYRAGRLSQRPRRSRNSGDDAGRPRRLAASHCRRDHSAVRSRAACDLFHSGRDVFRGHCNRLDVAERARHSLDAEDLTDGHEFHASRSDDRRYPRRLSRAAAHGAAVGADVS